MKENKNHMLSILLFLTIVATIFSQSKIVFDNGIAPVLQFSWIILCIFSFNIKVLKKIYIPFSFLERFLYIVYYLLQL